MYIVFDIGGTKTRIARSDDLKTFGEPKVYKTPQSFDEGMQKMIVVIKKFAGNTGLSGIAGGVPSILNEDKTCITTSQNLPDWTDKPFVEILKQTFSTPVFLENDADLAGLGEAHFGAGIGYSRVLYLTISTGVGGGKIIDGMIAEPFEPGHEPLDNDKMICPECLGTTLEEYISGPSMEKRFAKPPIEIQDENIWNEYARILAHGIEKIALPWHPDTVILGGAMIIGNPAISIEKMMDTLKTLHQEASLPPVTKALLDDFGGLYGGLALMKQK